MNKDKYQKVYNIANNFYFMKIVPFILFFVKGYLAVGYTRRLPVFMEALKIAIPSFLLSWLKGFIRVLL